MEEKAVITMDSPEAASQETMTVWVSNNKRAFFDERAAKFDGCTHGRCQECKEVCEKSRLMCKTCGEKARQAVFDKMPEVEWDGKTPLCIFDSDTYFFYEDELLDYCDEHECKPEDLSLILCVPEYPRELTDEYFLSDFCEDIELSKKIQSMIERFNKELKEINEPIAWVGGNQRVKVVGK